MIVIRKYSIVDSKLNKAMQIEDEDEKNLNGT